MLQLLHIHQLLINFLISQLVRQLLRLLLVDAYHRKWLAQVLLVFFFGERYHERIILQNQFLFIIESFRWRICAIFGLYLRICNWLNHGGFGAPKMVEQVMNVFDVVWDAVYVPVLSLLLMLIRYDSVRQARMLRSWGLA